MKMQIQRLKHIYPISLLCFLFYQNLFYFQHLFEIISISWSGKEIDTDDDIFVVVGFQGDLYADKKANLGNRACQSQCRKKSNKRFKIPRKHISSANFLEKIKSSIFLVKIEKYYVGG